MKTFYRDHWLKLVAIAMLLGVLTNYFPMVYYQLTNWAVMGAALTAAWQFYKRGNLWFTWIFVVVAVVFNPLAPLHIQQDIWRVIDLVGAALLVVGIILLSSKDKK